MCFPLVFNLNKLFSLAKFSTREHGCPFLLLFYEKNKNSKIVIYTQHIRETVDEQFLPFVLFGGWHATAYCKSSCCNFSCLSSSISWYLSIVLFHQSNEFPYPIWSFRFTRCISKVHVHQFFFMKMVKSLGT